MTRVIDNFESFTNRKRPSSRRIYIYIYINTRGCATGWLWEPLDVLRWHRRTTLEVSVMKKKIFGVDKWDRKMCEKTLGSLFQGQVRKTKKGRSAVLQKKFGPSRPSTLGENT